MAQKITHPKEQPSIKSCLLLGKASLEGSPDLDPLISDAKEMYRYWVHQDLLVRVIDELSIQDAGYLTCGLVTLEKKLNWEGGSVGAVICAYRALRAKKPDIEWLDDLTQWIIENTKNAYNPFGTVMKHGAKNLTEFAQRRREHESRAWKNIRKAEEQREVSLKQKLSYERFKENSLKLRQSGERRALSANFDLDSIEGIIHSLEEIAADIYTANVFSTKVADSASISVLDEVDYYTKKELALRLIGRKRGPWGQFKKRLYRSLSCDVGRPWSRLSEDVCICDIYEHYVEEFNSLEPEEQEGGIEGRSQYIDGSIRFLSRGEAVDGVWYHLPVVRHYDGCHYSLTEAHPNWPDLKQILAAHCIHDWNEKYFTPLSQVLDGGPWDAVIRLEGVSHVMGGYNAEPNGFDEILDLVSEKGIREILERY
jgi:hypothetical protein